MPHVGLVSGILLEKLVHKLRVLVLETRQMFVVHGERGFLVVFHLLGLVDVVLDGLAVVLDVFGVGFVVGIVLLQLEAKG